MIGARQVARSRFWGPHHAGRKLIVSTVLLLLVASTSSRANVWYEADLTPLNGDEPSGDYLWGTFPPDPIERNTPDCSETEPMGLDLYLPSLDGELTAIVFRVGGVDGQLVFELPPNEAAIDFDRESCELLTTWRGPGNEEQTSFFIVIETTSSPDGFLGGLLRPELDQPVLESSWGLVKAKYRVVAE